MARFELAASCSQGTPRPSPDVARHRLMRHSPATIMAGCGLVSPSDCPRWLPTWLPEIPLAPLTFHDRAWPWRGQNRIPAIRAPALEAVMQPARLGLGYSMRCI